jgi:hypothetical protein
MKIIERSIEAGMAKIEEMKVNIERNEMKTIGGEEIINEISKRKENM